MPQYTTATIAKSVLELLSADPDLAEFEFSELNPHIDRHLDQLTTLPNLAVGVQSIGLRENLQWADIVILIARNPDEPSPDAFHAANNAEHILTLIYQDGGEIRSSEGDILTYALREFETIHVHYETRKREFAVMEMVLRFATSWRRARKPVI